MVGRMKIVVAGAAGFIGSNLVSHLLQNTGHIVISMDDLSGVSTLKNLQFALGHRNDRHKFYPCDINSEITERLFRIEQPDIIVNLSSGLEINENGTGFADICSKTNSIKKYIILRKDSVFSECPQLCKNFEVIKIDSCNVFGPRQSIRENIPRILAKNFDILGKHKALLPTDQKDSYVYVKDLIDALLLIIEGMVDKIPLYKIGSDHKTSQANIETFVQNLISGKIVELQTERVENTSSIQLIDAGWKIRRPLFQAIEHTLDWYNNNRWAFGE